MRGLVYYVSGHGFGHAVRSAEIMRALHRIRPELPIFVRSSAPGWLFPATTEFSACEVDVGVVQTDALHVDPTATLRRAADFAQGADQRLTIERSALRATNAGLVVGDVPALAFLAAAGLRVPSIAVANFSWDWIYEPYFESVPAYGWLRDWLRTAYSRASLLLRLPFHGPMTAFSTVEDVPLVSRPPSTPRDQVRAGLGLSAEQVVVLLSFGGLGLRGLEPALLGRLTGYVFLATEKEIDSAAARPPNLRVLPANQANYSDLVAASDVVLSKPGFGIVASCLANRVPLLYTDRGCFPEYPILVEALHQLGRAEHIPADALLAGRIGPYLDSVRTNPAQWAPLRLDGAVVIATRLLELLDGAT